ncbi:potassium channel family protein [Marinobacter xestospongiae]|uniref:Potassium channel family protein n=1 Tax=Marinobacter xestospongiae TaxID=994319 RepID=A0ABU3VZ95_9GAMM|nr:potassium channel family protein [Marinobacter xestospongiae]MDV2079608.1 potassium channel family protein [Marinobacter xestospongiae]
MFLRLLLRRRAHVNITRHLDRNMKMRLQRALAWLLGLSGLHVLAMVLLEGLTPGDALWLTLTTLTTVGYGDLSAATPAGRLATTVLLYFAGITLLAQLASDYIDYRLKQKDYMIKGLWRWRMKDHVLIVNSPARNPAVYFQRLVDQLRATDQFADRPVLILTDAFPDGLPARLREQGVVHYHGESSDRASLAAVDPGDARAIIVLAQDEYSRVSDSVTLDVLMQLNDLCHQRLPYTVAESVEEDNRRRAEAAGANTTLRPVRAYPEILVRALVAPGAEKILENLFTHHDDHTMRYPVTLDQVQWSDVACQLLTAGMGTLMAYVTDTGHVECHPAPDHRFSASALILMVREEAIPTAHQVREALADLTATPDQPRSD